MRTTREKKTIETRETAEVKDFRAAISEAFSAPQEQLCLTYAGNILKVFMPNSCVYRHGAKSPLEE